MFVLQTAHQLHSYIFKPTAVTGDIILIQSLNRAVTLGQPASFTFNFVAKLFFFFAIAQSFNNDLMTLEDTIKL